MEDLKLFVKVESISLFNQALSLVSRVSQIPSCFSQPHLETDSQTNPFPATRKKKKRHQTLLVFPYTMKHNTPSKCQTRQTSTGPLSQKLDCIPAAQTHSDCPTYRQYWTTLSQQRNGNEALSVSQWFSPPRWRTSDGKHRLRKKQCHCRIISYSPSTQRALRVHFNISKAMKKLCFKVY